MRFWNRFSIGKLFAAVFCISTLFVFGVSWILIFAFELAAIYVISEMLIGYLPSQIEKRLHLNCIRLDGSWSCRREVIEHSAVNKLRWDIRVILVLIMIPTTMLIWMFDREVAPISIGVSALPTILVSADRSDLASEEHQFDAWSKKRAFGTEDTAHKRVLGKAWPVIIIVGVGWLIACWLLIQNMYVRQLKDLVKGIEDRKWRYSLVDRSRSVEWSDLATKN